jgi:ribosome-binding protein aMBF1 (putative translation factor)
MRSMRADWDPTYTLALPNEQRGLDALGRSVFERRRALGLSQRGLSARAGVPQSMISRLERGLLPGTKLRRLGAILDALQGLVVRPP